MMDIYSKKGTIVTFTGCSEEQHRFGSHTGDFKQLEIGKKYVIEKTEVHTMHTKVYLQNIEGCFNSVCFEDSDGGK